MLMSVSGPNMVLLAMWLNVGCRMAGLSGCSAAACAICDGAATIPTSDDAAIVPAPKALSLKKSLRVMRVCFMGGPQNLILLCRIKG